MPKCSHNSRKTRLEGWIRTSNKWHRQQWAWKPRNGRRTRDFFNHYAHDIQNQRIECWQALGCSALTGGASDCPSPARDRNFGTTARKNLSLCPFAVLMLMLLLGCRKAEAPKWRDAEVPKSANRGNSSEHNKPHPSPNGHCKTNPRAGPAETNGPTGTDTSDADGHWTAGWRWRRSPGQKSARRVCPVTPRFSKKKWELCNRVDRREYHLQITFDNELADGAHRVRLVPSFLTAAATGGGRVTREASISNVGREPIGGSIETDAADAGGHWVSVKDLSLNCYNKLGRTGSRTSVGVTAETPQSLCASLRIHSDGRVGCRRALEPEVGLCIRVNRKNTTCRSLWMMNWPAGHLTFDSCRVSSPHYEYSPRLVENFKFLFFYYSNLTWQGWRGRGTGVAWLTLVTRLLRHECWELWCIGLYSHGPLVESDPLHCLTLPRAGRTGGLLDSWSIALHIPIRN
jgi:hypothetical protein